MGFPLVCYCFAVPKPLITFCKFLSAIGEAVLLMLAILGLCRFPHDAARGSAEGPLPEELKVQLPAVQFGQLVAADEPSSPRDDDEALAPSSAACIVCLESLEATDEVRRLGNCAHAFHRGCIDRWIDLGRATCPLCRSNLLPPQARAGSLGLGRLASLLARVW